MGFAGFFGFGVVVVRVLWVSLCGCFVGLLRVFRWVLVLGVGFLWVGGLRLGGGLVDLCWWVYCYGAGVVVWFCCLFGWDFLVLVCGVVQYDFLCFGWAMVGVGFGCFTLRFGW